MKTVKENLNTEKYKGWIIKFKRVKNKISVIIYWWMNKNYILDNFFASNKKEGLLIAKHTINKAAEESNITEELIEELEK